MYIEPGYEEREEAIPPTTSLPMSHTEVMPTRLSIPEKILARFTVYEELTVANKPEQFEAVFRRLQNEWTVICGLVRDPSHVLPGTPTADIFHSWWLSLRKCFVLQLVKYILTAVPIV